MNFQNLVLLFNEDPEAFEAKRKELLLAKIKELNVSREREEHLRAALWQMDKKLEKCKDNTQRFNLLVEILFDSANKLNDAWHCTPLKKAPVINISDK